MPELRCQECGKELLPRTPDAIGDACVCQKCGRDVYVWDKAKEAVKCPNCGKTNETTVAR